MTAEQAETVIALLTEIRDSLKMPEHEEVPCLHPEDRRTNLGSMGEEEWICRECDLHYGPFKKGTTDAALPQHAD